MYEQLHELQEDGKGLRVGSYPEDARRRHPEGSQVNKRLPVDQRWPQAASLRVDLGCRPDLREEEPAEAFAGDWRERDRFRQLGGVPIQEWHCEAHW